MGAVAADNKCCDRVQEDMKDTTESGGREKKEYPGAAQRNERETRHGGLTPSCRYCKIWTSKYGRKATDFFVGK